MNDLQSSSAPLSDDYVEHYTSCSYHMYWCFGETMILKWASYTILHHNMTRSGYSYCIEEIQRLILKDLEVLILNSDRLFLIITNTKPVFEW